MRGRCRRAGLPGVQTRTPADIRRLVAKPITTARRRRSTRTPLGAMTAKYPNGAGFSVNASVTVAVGASSLAPFAGIELTGRPWADAG
jgi:hypothetical protein